MANAEPLPGRCNARLRGNSTGKFCSQHPMTGTVRCRMHSGAPAHEKHRQHVATEKARQLIPADYPGIDDPIQALLDLTAEAVAFKAAVASMVNDLGDRFRRSDGAGGEQLRAEVVVYERALDRAGRLLVDINRLGLEERLVKIRESEAQRMFAALQAALKAAGLDEEQQREARRVAARHLRPVG